MVCKNLQNYQARNMDLSQLYERQLPSIVCYFVRILFADVSAPHSFFDFVLTAHQP